MRGYSKWPSPSSKFYVKSILKSSVHAHRKVYIKTWSLLHPNPTGTPKTAKLGQFLNSTITPKMLLAKQKKKKEKLGFSNECLRAALGLGLNRVGDLMMFGQFDLKENTPHLPFENMFTNRVASLFDTKQLTRTLLDFPQAIVLF